jgi:hypothetical protein
MALFKVSKGTSNNLPSTLTEGYCWYTYDDSKFYIDFKDENDVLIRKAINAQDAETLTGMTLEQIKNSISWNNLLDKPELVELSSDLASSGKAADSKVTGDTIAGVLQTATNNYNESIIGLSVDGQTVTYIKGDGSTHTFVTQDTNTTYSLGTDETTGLTKLYATTGSAEDGTMTQKAIKTELDKKVGVSVNSTQLIFTI